MLLQQITLGGGSLCNFYLTFLDAEPDMKSIKISFTTFVASIASTAVLAVTLTLCFTVTITALRLMMKKKARSLKALQQVDSEKHQATEIRVYEPITHHLKPGCVTLENEAYVANSTAAYKQ